MPSSNIRDKFARFVKIKETLSIEEKKKLIYGLKLLRRNLEKENTMTMSPEEPPEELIDVLEEEPSTERNVISKTFVVNGDFDPYVNQNRGIQFTPKELEAISNFKKITVPTLQNSFEVEYENTDEFGNNTTTVIKKFLQQPQQQNQKNQFVFTAFTKNDNSVRQEPEPKPSSVPKPMMPSQPPKNKQLPVSKNKPLQQQPSKPPVNTPPIKEETPQGNQITVTKTIPFQDEIAGSDILADLLRKLDL